MNYLIWKDNIPYGISEEGIVSLENRLEILKGLFQIAVVKTTPRIFESDSTDPEELERIALQTLPENYTICYEKIDKTLYQVFGIENSLLEEIKKTIDPERINLLIPYQVVIRGYLKRINILTSEYTIFLDDIESSILFSVLHNKNVSPVRSLTRETFSREFTVGQQDFISTEKLPLSTKFKIITNSKELKDTLLQEKIADEEAILLVEDSCPAFGGLRVGRAEVEFVLPEQILRERKETKKKQSIRFAEITGGIALISVFLLLQGYCNYHRTKKVIEQLRIKKTMQISQLEKFNQATYQSIIKEQQQQHLVPTLKKFFRYIPILSNIQEANIRREGDNIVVCAYVQEKEDMPLSINKLKQVFPTALIENSSIKGVPSIRIIYAISKKGAEVSGSPFRDGREAGAKK